jgi:hypothetical protein
MNSKALIIVGLIFLPEIILRYLVKDNRRIKEIFRIVYASLAVLFLCYVLYFGIYAFLNNEDV